MGRAVVLNHVPAGEWLVHRAIETELRGNAACLRRDPGRSASPVTVAEYQLGAGSGQRRHRVTIDQQGAAEALRDDL